MFSKMLCWCWLVGCSNNSREPPRISMGISMGISIRPLPRIFPSETEANKNKSVGVSVARVVPGGKVSCIAAAQSRLGCRM